MRITVNGKTKNVEDGCKARDLFGCEIAVIADGYQVDGDYCFSDGDDVVAIDKRVAPPAELLERMTHSRNGAEVNAAVKNARILIAGLGGIGSNLAVNLARLGAGGMTLIDFDTVDASNLNRQSYYIQDLGEYKTAALSRQIADINPYIQITAVNAKIDGENVDAIISDCDIVCECFDKPECKALLVNAALRRGKSTVACSGMAGYGKAGEIIVKRAIKNLYVVGDGVSEAKKGMGLMSPRVAVCAGMMANAVLRLLMGLEP